MSRSEYPADPDIGWWFTNRATFLRNVQRSVRSDVTRAGDGFESRLSAPLLVRRRVRMKETCPEYVGAAYVNGPVLFRRERKCRVMHLGMQPQGGVCREFDSRMRHHASELEAKKSFEP